MALMRQKRRNYHSYLLRLWRSSDDDGAPWQIMLENPHTGARHGFTGFRDLTVFLNQAIGRKRTAEGLDEGGAEHDER